METSASDVVQHGINASQFIRLWGFGFATTMLFWSIGYMVGVGKKAARLAA